MKKFRKIKKIDMELVYILVKSLALSMMIVGTIMALIYSTKLFMGGENKVSIVKLRSIEYTSNSSGAFIIGIGQLKNREYYVAYALQEDGGKKLVKYRADITIIYETLNENDEVYAEVVYNGFGNIGEVKLYLPKNTIKEEYDLNLS